MGSPPLLRRPAASGGGFVALLAVPVAVAVAGLAVVATLQGPHAGPAPGVDQAAALRARVAAAPQDATAWAELGTLVLRLAADTGDPRRYPDADAALGRSLQLRPDGNAAALGGLAALRTVQRRYAEAQDLARRALALDPNDPAVWGTLADAASGLGRYDESRVAVGHMFERRADVAALTRSAALDETSAGSTRPAPRWSGPSAPRPPPRRRRRRTRRWPTSRSRAATPPRRTGGSGSPAPPTPTTPTSSRRRPPPRRHWG